MVEMVEKMKLICDPIENNWKDIDITIIITIQNFIFGQYVQKKNTF